MTAIAAIVLVAGAAVLALITNEYRDERRAAVAQLRGQATADATVQAQLVRTQLDLLQTLAANDAIRRGDPPAIDELFSRLDPAAVGFTGGYAWIDGTGIVRAISGSPQVAPVSFADRDWFRAASQGQRYVGTAVLSRLRGGAPAITLAVPTGDGSSTGVLAAGFLLDRPGVITRALGSQDSTRFVLDRAGHVIIDSRGPVDRLRVARDGTWPARVGPSAGGSEVGVTDALGRSGRAVAWDSVPEAGWVTARSDSTDAVFSAPRRVFLRGVVLLAVTVVSLLGFGWWLARRVQRRADVQARVLDRQDAFNVAMGALAAAASPTEVAQAVVDFALPAVGARAGGLSLYDEDRGRLLTLHRRGYASADEAPWHDYAATEASPGGVAALTGEPVYLEDGELNAAYPHATGPLRSQGDQAWAIVPLLDGPHVLGVMSASFVEPDALDVQTRLELEVLAERTAGALARATRHELEHEATLAFQASVLPREPAEIDGVTVRALYRAADPAFGVGGDWYDTIVIDEHRLMVVVGDVVGRGIHAAATMGHLRAAAHTLATTHRPADLLTVMNDYAREDAGAFASSMCCMLVDTLEETVEYAHAGHPPIVVVNQDGTARTLENGRGALLGVAPFHVQAGRLHLDGVEAAVLYTDGLVERRGEPLDLCIDRLVDLLGVRLTCEEILDRCAGHGPAEDDTIVVRLDFAPVPRRLNLFADANLSAP